MKLAVITYQDRGSYAVEAVPDEDQLLSLLLDQLNISYRFEVWSDNSVNWKQYDALLLKSPWDYFDYFEDFKGWCQNIQDLGIPVWNDLNTVLWNSDKKYLLDIKKAGLGIVSTTWIAKGSMTVLEDIIQASDEQQQFVIKPAISGGSKNTLKFHVSEWGAIQSQISEWIQQEAYLLQPFVPEIAEIGEYSYIFFNGEFSHALVKKASAGEFRVQHFFGGTIHPFEPSLEELTQIKTYVDTFAQDTLYARVDGVWRAGEFLLMELELIEPYLFLFTHPKALENYKSALQKRLV
ncbi:ATP-grasp domain-containing protein [Mongoliitalea daihaiensis]|uniref:ATP-grasp domain-containing protein n=1 Tax=Mongoliitalea daihaiensis TaxID=2782006 RepID=UPI001F409BB1|nr:glutathione synthetase [Mongoliitalea daihaiensis]UJP64532.1 glutathione synthetase [Mongoliitalea daihaiensis]